MSYFNVYNCGQAETLIDLLRQPRSGNAAATAVARASGVSVWTVPTCSSFVCFFVFVSYQSNKAQIMDEIEKKFTQKKKKEKSKIVNALCILAKAL